MIALNIIMILFNTGVLIIIGLLLLTILNLFCEKFEMLSYKQAVYGFALALFIFGVIYFLILLVAGTAMSFS